MNSYEQLSHFSFSQCCAKTCVARKSHYNVARSSTSAREQRDCRRYSVWIYPCFDLDWVHSVSIQALSQPVITDLSEKLMLFAFRFCPPMFKIIANFGSNATSSVTAGKKDLGIMVCSNVLGSSMHFPGQKIARYNTSGGLW